MLECGTELVEWNVVSETGNISHRGYEGSLVGWAPAVAQACIPVRPDVFSQNHKVVSQVQNPCWPNLLMVICAAVLLAAFVELTFIEYLVNSSKDCF